MFANHSAEFCLAAVTQYRELLQPSDHESKSLVSYTADAEINGIIKVGQLHLSLAFLCVGANNKVQQHLGDCGEGRH